MPTKGTSVKGIRLANGVWREIDQAAQQASESRNEWISKRLPWLLSHECVVGKSDEMTDETDTLEFE